MGDLRRMSSQVGPSGLQGASSRQLSSFGPGAESLAGTRARPARREELRPIYNVPAVVQKRKEIMEEMANREKEKMDQEMAKGAAESKILHIEDGMVREDIGFQFFHRERMLIWKQVLVLLLELEDWAKRVGVSHVAVNSEVGQHLGCRVPCGEERVPTCTLCNPFPAQLLVKVAERSTCRGRAPNPEDLLCCVTNLEQVEKELKLPGWRFRGDHGMVTATLWIQKIWRGMR